jgi:arylformamidase
MKKLIDISIELSGDIPVWPGDPSPVFERFSKIEDGESANVSTMSMGVHTGTHIDAPYHFIINGKMVGDLDPDIFIGPVQVVQIPEESAVINSQVLAEANLDFNVSRILFKTRNSNIWQQGMRTFQKDFVAVDADGAKWLLEKDFKLIGVDYLSIAPFDFPIETHQLLLEKEVVLLEGINLSDVEPGYYDLICLPLKIKNAEGAPARAFLVRE